MEIFKPAKVSKTYRVKHCLDCEKVDFCEALYLYECNLVMYKYCKLNEPCNTCSYVQVDDDLRLFCDIHNCKNYKLFCEVK